MIFMEAIDFSKLSPEAAGLVTKPWVEQNDACPYQKTGERIQFATSRSTDEHPALKSAIEALGVDNFGITALPRPTFEKLVAAQLPHFERTLSEATGPANIKQIVAEAGAKAGVDAEGIRR